MTSAPKFPSFNWMRGVSVDPGITHLHRLILIRLCLYRDDKTGQCNPGIQTVADELKVFRTTVFRAIDAGIKRGWLAKAPNHGGRIARNFVFAFPLNRSGTATVNRSGTATVETPTVALRHGNRSATARQPSQAVLQDIEPPRKLAPERRRERKKRTGKKDSLALARERETQAPDVATRDSKRSPRKKTAVGTTPAKSNRAPKLVWEKEEELKGHSCWKAPATGGAEYTVRPLIAYPSGKAVGYSVTHRRKNEGRRHIEDVRTVEQGKAVAERDHTARTEPETQLGDSFLEFWRCFPRHVARAAAERAFAAAIEDGVDAEVLIAGARAYSATRAGEPEKYTAHASTWLRGRRWQDEPPPRADGPPIIDGVTGEPVAVAPQRERNKPKTWKEVDEEVPEDGYLH